MKCWDKIIKIENIYEEKNYYNKKQLLYILYRRSEKDLTQWKSNMKKCYF